MNRPRIGVISNAHSRRNKMSMQAFEAVLAAHPQVLHRAFAGIDELPHCLRFMAEAGVTHLVVSGGDGTVLAAVTQLINASPFAAQPRLSLLSAGMTNAIAHEVGETGLPAASLPRLVARIEAGDPGQAIERSVLSVDLGDGRGIERGFLLGAVGFYQATMLTRREIHRLGAKYAFAAKLGIFWSVAKLLVLGPGERSGLRGERLDLILDGKVESLDCLLLLATSLDSLLPGISPFWGGGNGRMRLTTVVDPPRRLARAAWPLLRGRPLPWMEAAGYRSRRLDALALRIASPLVIDGEIFPPPADGWIRITAGPAVTFHRYAP